MSYFHHYNAYSFFSNSFRTCKPGDCIEALPSKETHAYCPTASYRDENGYVTKLCGLASLRAKPDPCHRWKQHGAPFLIQTQPPAQARSATATYDSPRCGGRAQTLFHNCHFINSLWKKKKKKKSNLFSKGCLTGLLLWGETHWTTAAPGATQSPLGSTSLPKHRSLFLHPVPPASTHLLKEATSLSPTEANLWLS